MVAADKILHAASPGLLSNADGVPGIISIYMNSFHTVCRQNSSPLVVEVVVVHCAEVESLDSPLGAGVVLQAVGRWPERNNNNKFLHHILTKPFVRSCLDLCTPAV